MVKYATAIRTGTASTKAILRRFMKPNAAHPTYQAMIEPGRAQKTILLARYLRSRALQREIHEGPPREDRLDPSVAGEPLAVATSGLPSTHGQRAELCSAPSDSSTGLSTTGQCPVSSATTGASASAALAPTTK